MGNAAKISEITATEAMKFFKGTGITVQEAKAVKTTGEDGKAREGYKTRDATLAEAHILAAKDYGSHVAITTIDGRRYEAKK